MIWFRFWAGTGAEISEEAHSGNGRGGNKLAFLLSVTLHTVPHSCRYAVTAGGQYMRPWDEVNSWEYKDDSLKSHP